MFIILLVDDISSQDESGSVEDKEIKSIPDLKEIEELNASEADRETANSLKDKKKEAQFKDNSNDKK